MKDRCAPGPIGSGNGLHISRGPALDHRADRLEHSAHFPGGLGLDTVFDDLGQALFEGPRACRIDAERALQAFCR